jgi:hypothetical protein
MKKKIIEYIKHIRDVCRARREEAKAAKIAYQQEIEYAQANIGTIDYQTCKEHQRETMKRCLKNDYENLISSGMTAGISDDDKFLLLHYGTQKPAIFLTGKFSDIITELINSMIENNE